MPQSRPLLLGAIILLAALQGGVPSGVPAQSPEDIGPKLPNAVARLYWMAGCWEMRTPTRVTHEQWMSPLGGMMLGMSRTVVRDVAREFEALRVESRDGAATYIAQPAGQSSTAFRASDVSDSAVVFSNPAHDFPKRIIYARAGADSLIARIEGERGDRVRGMDLPMKRVACGGQ
ncbi:MAG: DUF6265 family protein [Gemmatimonadaceae bacterium]|nr:DUF6265 family protein [Gemmatimonadaceae bacterium]